MSTISTNLPGDGDFTFEETQALERDDIFRFRSGPGERKVSYVAQSGSWDTPSFSSPIATWGATTHSIGYKQKRSRSFLMPTAVISAEALEYIGFMSTTAQFIFYQFQNRPDPDNNPATLMDYVICHVNQIYSLQKGGHTAEQAMIRVGLDESFRKQIQTSLDDDSSEEEDPSEKYIFEEDILEENTLEEDLWEEDLDEENFSEQTPDAYFDDEILPTNTLLRMVLSDLKMGDSFLKMLHERLKQRARELIAINPDWSTTSNSASVLPRARRSTKTRSRISGSMLESTRE
ncbi:hypothetical protein VE03_09535 [Pseudogymnoascus sp. 23342-1-I1]|nr:hypothetical protein VE03_09535 [Pseudogymnoascus sp. 23342-1-I1]